MEQQQTKKKNLQNVLIKIIFNLTWKKYEFLNWNLFPTTSLFENKFSQKTDGGCYKGTWGHD